MNVDDGIARWRRVADGIRTLAAESDADGGLLPSEAALAERFGVNRHTVRRAIAALAAEGLVHTERGRGTFFRKLPGRLHYPIGTRTRFSENISRQAREPAGRLIQASVEPADARIAAALGLRIGAAVHRMETLHVADGMPLSVSTSWFSVERFPAIVAAYAETGSVSKALEAHGLVDYHRRETRVAAEHVSPADAAHLACPADAIVIVAESLNVDPEGQPMQRSRTRFAADRIELVFAT
ncbi:phosphonate metabolism transcriptional regulator PhnF [Aquamicrobium sp. LC103]|uniref:phosphonate metabolism transcriptional regulator PhnF n=1 Tax=Aquamicrobium sp. LC103 TaxID=1120658 RepID=UPI00063EBACB|nr:phosphonate metabolism transcriptional regulator PhnF [Aquamicrobium sp. LC103]TKT74647.1 phosphonate metabolism transcriptional regulator PhnF [Aquamicrobium sp. LC103]